MTTTPPARGAAVGDLAQGQVRGVQGARRTVPNAPGRCPVATVLAPPLDRPTALWHGQHARTAGGAAQCVNTGTAP